MTRFSAGFETLIVEIYAISCDINTGRSKKEAVKEIFAKTEAAAAQINDIIRRFMANPVPGESARGLFMTFLVSYRPQLESALQTLKNSVESPKDAVEDALEQKEKELSNAIAEAIESARQPPEVTQDSSTVSEKENPETLVYNPEFHSYMVPLEHASSSSSESQEEEEEEEEEEADDDLKRECFLELVSELKQML